MFDLNKNIPGYLTEKRNITKLIVFTALFALVFINFYAPFGIETWRDVTPLGLLGLSSLVTLTGVLVVVISRVIMYHRAAKKRINYWQYFVWIFIEILCMSLFYALFQKIILDDTRYFPDILKITMQNVALVLLLPYSVLWLYFSWVEKKEELDKISSGSSFTGYSKQLVPFHDDKGVLRLSVKLEDLIYLEAADNYVNIYYSQKDKVSKFMLRNTLKKLETELSQSVLIRCHRSYMVNFEKVKVIRKEKDGLKLELDSATPILIPVSRTYFEDVIKTFANYCHPSG